MSQVKPGDHVKINQGALLVEHYKTGPRTVPARRAYKVYVRRTATYIADDGSEALRIFWTGSGGVEKSCWVYDVTPHKNRPVPTPVLTPADQNAQLERVLCVRDDAAEALRLAELAREYAEEAQGAAAAASLVAEQAEDEAAEAAQRAGLKVVDGGQQSTLLKTSKTDQPIMRARSQTYRHFRARAELLTEAAVKGKEELLRVLGELYVFDSQLAKFGQVVGCESEPANITRDMNWMLTYEQAMYAFEQCDLQQVADVLKKHLVQTNNADKYKVQDLLEHLEQQCDEDLRPEDTPNAWAWTRYLVLVVDGNRFRVQRRTSS